MRRKAEAVETGNDEIVVKNKTAKKVMGFIFLGITLAMVVVIVVLMLQRLFKPTYELSENGQYYIVTDVGDKQKEFEIEAEYEGLPVKEIGEEAFKDATALEKVVIPEGVEKIGQSAFENCSALKEVVFSSTVKELSGYSFQNCDALESITFPESLTVIAGSAFSDCDGLKEIVIPDTVVEVKGWAFKECDGVKKISIGKNVAKIGKEAFAGCANVEEIYFNAANCVVVEAAQPGASDQRPQAMAPFVGAGRDASSLVCTIGKDVTKVPDALFIGYTKALTEVIFEKDGVCTEIGTESFADVNKMTKIVLPKTIKKIGQYAFAGCEKLDILYEGTYDEFNSTINANSYGSWKQVDKNTNNSSRITIYYYSKEETSSAYTWHYVDGVPKLWNPAPAQN